MRTDYLAHDDEYRQRRARGLPGWADAQEIERQIRVIQEFLDRPYAPKHGRVLEIGCGAGGLTRWLAERGYEAYGVDIAPSAIEWARDEPSRLGSSVDFRVGDARTLSAYDDRFFDVAIDGHCLHCIIGPDRTEYLRSVHRILRPDGVFRVDTHCGDVRDPALRARFDPQTRCIVRDGRRGPFAERYVGPREGILEEVRLSGFEILTWELRNGGPRGLDSLVIDARAGTRTTQGLSPGGPVSGS